MTGFAGPSPARRASGSHGRRSGGFLRTVTHPRVMDRPLSTEQAWGVLDGWLASPVAWLPPFGERTTEVLRQVMLDTRVSGARTADAQLAALAVEHGVPVVTTDTDFAGFPQVTVINPLGDA